MRAQRGSYSSALSLTAALDGVGIQRHPWPLNPRERDPVPISVDKMMTILQWILQTMDCRTCVGLIWLWIRTNGGLF